MKRKHYHLVSGQVIYKAPDQDQLGVVPLNAVIDGDERNIPVRAIAKAQQALVAQFHMKQGLAAETELHDVVIITLMHLGHMTEAEFNAQPETSVEDLQAAMVN